MSSSIIFIDSANPLPGVENLKEGPEYVYVFVKDNLNATPTI